MFATLPVCENTSYDFVFIHVPSSFQCSYLWSSGASIFRPTTKTSPKHAASWRLLLSLTARKTMLLHPFRCVEMYKNSSYNPWVLSPNLPSIPGHQFSPYSCPHNQPVLRSYFQSLSCESANFWMDKIHITIQYQHTLNNFLNISILG